MVLKYKQMHNFNTTINAAHYLSKISFKKLLGLERGLSNALKSEPINKN
jgi:hypothetical protein